MPVDDTILDAKVDEMRTFVRTKRDEYTKARDVSEALESIKMVQDINDETKKTKPTDPKTHKEISTVRRQELYTYAITEATTLLP